MFWIRADGNEKIGAGHLMRCMTVAQELVKLWGRDNVRFLCADPGSGAMAEEAGFRTDVLDTDYRDMEAELPAWERIFEDSARELTGTENLILVDSYYVTDKYLRTLGSLGVTVLLDDLGGHPWPVDCVINYNAHADLEQYRALYHGTGTRLLIGSEYVPLRHQFRGRKYQVREVPKTILITTGGSDVENIGDRILKRLYREGMEFYLVTGRFNPHLQELWVLEEKLNNLHVCHDVKDMAGLMEQCDIAVTAGGTTVYELAAIGVPFLCFSCAENQEALEEYIGKTDIAGAVGPWHKDPERTLERMAGLFEELIGNADMRRSFHQREKSMIDGLGAIRLADLLGRDLRNRH